MFNQISIKPQEVGSMQDFPTGSVSIDGRMVEEPVNRFSSQVMGISPETAKKNPISESDGSMKNGKVVFDTYCFICHGDSKKTNKEGFADTRINTLGMIAPAIAMVSHHFTDEYIHNKINYGGSIMPSLGYATTQRDRWDAVHYIRELEKQPSVAGPE